MGIVRPVTTFAKKGINRAGDVISQAQKNFVMNSTRNSLIAVSFFMLTGVALTANFNSGEGAHTVNDESDAVSVSDNKSSESIEFEAANSVNQGESASDESADQTEEAQADEDEQSLFVSDDELQHSRINISIQSSTSSSGGSETDDDSGEETTVSNNSGVTLNGEPVELSRTGRFKERVEEDGIESTVKLDIDIEGDADFNLSVSE